MYPRVVISSLTKRLEKPPFCHSYTSFGAWPRDHYLLLKRPTKLVCHAFLRIIEQMVPACSAKVSPQMSPLAPCGSSDSQSVVTKNDAIPHSTEQDTQPIAFLISKQAVPYQTRGGTCCPRVSTPKIRSLIDLSITYHDGINHLHHSNHCSNHSIDPHMVTSHLDGWKTTTL
jgi:hypothetical protein